MMLMLTTNEAFSDHDMTVIDLAQDSSSNEYLILMEGRSSSGADSNYRIISRNSILDDSQSDLALLALEK